MTGHRQFLSHFEGPHDFMRVNPVITITNNNWKGQLKPLNGLVYGELNGLKFRMPRVCNRAIL